ncbi:MAG: sigma 54-interacting transcriptional regulator [Tissierellia bacterium]|nr:sigma 54-interacting transcriptional regulator [Tissierellia bacterium]
MCVKDIVELDSLVKRRLINLAEKNNLDLNSLVERLIDEREVYEEKLKNIKEEYEVYKIRDITALKIGDAIMDGICVTDGDGNIIDINKGYTKITGLTKKDLIGLNVEKFLGKKCYDMEVTFEVLKKKRKISKMSIINNKQLLIIGNPFFNMDGQLTQIITVLRDLTELIALKEKLEEKERENLRYLNELKYMRAKQKQGEFLGISAQAQKIRDTIYQVAKTDATVLIIGETGVGKEIVAREIHRNSLRNNEPYIKINCSAIPETLLESEFFGYEKGAFTGAMNREKIGLLEAADRGTVLLDEVGDMPLHLQPKILRFLQEKEITRIGSTRPIKIDVRVIAATNQNLEELVKKGKFREDLYYRLNVIPIRIPPLRERKEDIRILVHKFIVEFNKRYNKQVSFTEKALEVLESYEWPGNVRELENTIQRLIIMNNHNHVTDEEVIGILGIEKICLDLAVNDELSLKESLEILEKQIIEKALKKYGTTYKAAESLKVSQSTIVRKAKEYGIEW